MQSYCNIYCKIYTHIFRSSVSRFSLQLGVMVPLMAYTWNMFNIGKASVVKAHHAMLFYLFILDLGTYPICYHKTILPEDLTSSIEKTLKNLFFFKVY